jgi:hypothetical protein
MTSWENPDIPPGISKQFWSNVLAYESADETTHYQQLKALDIDLPAPDDLTDAELTTKLWDVIRALAGINVFLSQTDH